MAYVLGMNAKLYYNTGSYASPTWTLIDNVRDLTLNLERGDTDITTRGGGGWRQSVATLADGSIDFGMVWDTADTVFTAIKNAFINNTTVEFLALDGLQATTGSQGLRATMAITSFSRNEGLEDALTVDVSAKTAYADNAPEWYTAS
tara:strand:+ start:472 stop:912 length:441 start_codon:yes stop_codon:yes gene_type:complete